MNAPSLQDKMPLPHRSGSESHAIEVPFLDIRSQNRSIEAELQSAISEVVSNAQFILGLAVERFERSFADYAGVKHCVGLHNGTSALHMALVACDVGPRYEVIPKTHPWRSTSWRASSP